MITRGRHPLPTAEALQATLGRLGIDDSRQVVAYDDTGGAMAARLWWLLRYMGHGAVALLDGGWVLWEAAGLPTATGEERMAARVFLGSPRTEWLVRIDQVSDAPLLIDSRDPARYRGEVEPLDPVAGHIPGAVNYFWKENLDGQGRFLAHATLRARIQRSSRGPHPGRLCSTAAPGSRPAITSSRWRMPGCPLHGSTRALGASGAPIQGVPWRAVRRRDRRTRRASSTPYFTITTIRGRHDMGLDQDIPNALFRLLGQGPASPLPDLAQRLSVSTAVIADLLDALAD